MAGEWIPYDVCLPMKPEVLEIQDATGLATDAIIGRLVQLWGWAALNAEDGTFRMTISRLARTFGGDAAFWTAVQDVGWLEIDGEAGTVAIPGWERRFSQAAKTRALHSRRASCARERTDECAQAHGSVRPIAPERGDIGERNPSSSRHVGCASPEDWETLRKAWNAGPGRKWTLPTAPDKTVDRLAEAGWLSQSLTAIGRLPKCRFFADPVTLIQFVKPGFVQKVLGGQYDSPRQPKGGGYGREPEKAPAAAWSGDDAERFEATKRKLVQSLKEPK